MTHPLVPAEQSITMLPCAGLVVQPGDTLVVGLAGNPTNAVARQAKEQLEAMLPGVAVALVANVATMAVYSPPVLLDADDWVGEPGIRSVGVDAPAGGAGPISAGEDLSTPR
ncbi:hypothetical protein O7630_34540 [Micromonospora sp. WMMD718]|uniref:hypothetical protein n=1 Tax=Micromonospora sp. WMMD718 TaxID=3016098 RepID=UPI002415F366|nr:hypothetical protein [Micromonospora sp. WMMD718]MDG4749323.1 hypothetical protein [Micromonospora sp. WMMD718]MDG4756065.1 hypothetical protein [Micromonospora sp. WMMD718]